MSRSQNEPHVGYNNRMHEKDQGEIDSVRSSTDSAGSEWEKCGTTVHDYNPHSMAVGLKGENKKGNTEQYEEYNSSKGATILDTTWLNQIGAKSLRTLPPTHHEWMKYFIWVKTNKDSFYLGTKHETANNNKNDNNEPQTQHRQTEKDKQQWWKYTILVLFPHIQSLCK